MSPDDARWPPSVFPMMSGDSRAYSRWCPVTSAWTACLGCDQRQRGLWRNKADCSSLARCRYAGAHWSKRQVVTERMSGSSERSDYGNESAFCKQTDRCSEVFPHRVFHALTCIHCVNHCISTFFGLPSCLPGGFRRLLMSLREPALYIFMLAWNESKTDKTQKCNYV